MRDPQGVGRGRDAGSWSVSVRNTSGSWTRACELDLIKRPGSVETIDWANALALLGAEAVTGEAGRLTHSAGRSRTRTTCAWSNRGCMSSSVSDPVELATRFCRVLRAEGLAVGSGQVIDFCRAAAELEELYRAGLATLVSDRDELAVYDRVFRASFRGHDSVSMPEPQPDAPSLMRTADIAVLADPSDEEGSPEGRGWFSCKLIFVAPLLRIRVGRAVGSSALRRRAGGPARWWSRRSRPSRSRPRRRQQLGRAGGAFPRCRRPTTARAAYGPSARGRSGRTGSDAVAVRRSLT